MDDRSSEDKLLKAIRHYQENVTKYSDAGNEAKVLHAIKRLFELPITVAHLQETGVGRTINALRKYDGAIAKASRALVQEWKSLVEDDTEEEEVQQEPDSTQEDTQLEQQENDYTEENDEEIEEPVHKKKHKSKHSERDKETKIERSYTEEKSTIKKHNNEEKPKHKHKHDKHEKHDKYHKTTSTKHRSDDRKPCSSHDKHKESKHKEKNDQKRKYTESENESSNVKRKRHSADDSDENSSQENFQPEPSSSKHKSSHHKTDKHSHCTRENGQSIDKHKNKESSKSKHKSSSSSSSKSSHHEEKSKQDDKREKHKSTDKKSSKSGKKKGTSDANGIDCGSGTSFAEALGMMEDVPTIRTVYSKKKSKPERNPSPLPSTSNTSSKSTKSQASSSSSSSSSKRKTDSPTLLNSNMKLEPLELNIQATLPEITTNYKPLPVNYSYEFDTPMRPMSHMTEEEALDYVITSKTQRTKVYSGNKTWKDVPSLFNLCVKVLQDHIDSLEYTGGVPYSILKPVLERATPTQLFNAENHNPYLVEDTDELWELHCKKQFKGKMPQEMESWRDMYLRCCDEREAKLRSLTQNIKQSQEKSLPVRQTKLAYVDTIVKPPRAIARKQAKYGTGANNQPLITPSLRLKDVAAPKTANAITVPPPPQQRAPSSSTPMSKPKKAPLMQKTLAAFKSRFRR